MSYLRNMSMVVVAVCAAIGCGGGAPQDALARTEETKATERPMQLAQALAIPVQAAGSGGVLRGTVTLSGTPPTQKKLRLAADPVCQSQHAEAVYAEDVVVKQPAPDIAHEQVFRADRFPPATACATCHPKQYREWSVSQHAYAQMSPVFNAMHGTILMLTNGTNGDFCIRCHSPVGMNLGEPEFMSNIDRHPTSREGVTCIVCHRVNKEYGKISGRIAIVEGDILSPVYGPTGNDELARVLASPDQYRVVTTNEPGRKIHI